MSKWTTYQFDDAWNRITEPGVYAIFGDGKLIYIGESEFVGRRLNNHGLRWLYSNSAITPWGRFGTVIIKFRRSRRIGDWRMVEYRLIRRLRPLGNISGANRRRRTRQEKIQAVTF